VRGGKERRYRSRVAGHAEWEQEDPQLAIRAVTEELTRRLAGGPTTWRVFSDAELWVDPVVWDDIRARIAQAVIDLHNAAAAPHAEGSVHVSATAMLFQAAQEGAAADQESR
jgi:hypothetical protein